jgi:hypothetical protein
MTREVFTLTVIAYLLFAIPCGLICAITWIRHRTIVRLGWADRLILIVPWVIWICLVVSGYRDKSLSNVVEAALLGLASGLIFLVRSWSVTHVQRPQWQLALASLAASSLAAIAVWALVPALPE